MLQVAEQAWDILLNDSMGPTGSPEDDTPLELMSGIIPTASSSSDGLATTLQAAYMKVRQLDWSIRPSEKRVFPLDEINEHCVKDALQLPFVDVKGVGIGMDPDLCPGDLCPLRLYAMKAFSANELIGVCSGTWKPTHLLNSHELEVGGVLRVEDQTPRMTYVNRTPNGDQFSIWKHFLKSPKAGQKTPSEYSKYFHAERHDMVQGLNNHLPNVRFDNLACVPEQEMVGPLPVPTKNPIHCAAVAATIDKLHKKKRAKGAVKEKCQFLPLIWKDEGGYRLGLGLFAKQHIGATASKPIELKAAPTGETRETNVKKAKAAKSTTDAASASDALPETSEPPDAEYAVDGMKDTDDSSLPPLLPLPTFPAPLAAPLAAPLVAPLPTAQYDPDKRWADRTNNYKQDTRRDDLLYKNRDQKMKGWSLDGEIAKQLILDMMPEEKSKEQFGPQIVIQAANGPPQKTEGGKKEKGEPSAAAAASEQTEKKPSHLLLVCAVLDEATLVPESLATDPEPLAWTMEEFEEAVRESSK